MNRKTATMNLRVDPELKQNAEAVLDRLGIPMATAGDMFLNQIVLTEGLPFVPAIPKSQQPRRVLVRRYSKPGVGKKKL